ncbi:MAG: DUF6922 domain-containing protein [Flavisolibacter sp.]
MMNPGYPQKIVVTNGAAPELSRRLFWDARFEDINWQVAYRSVIARVLERGTKKDLEELIRFYGKPVIIQALKTEINYLPDHTIDEVTRDFNLQKEELVCYTRKQLRGRHWI